ncbi:hypothetical protein [Jiangella alkaliphila]|uniref:Uncharacterized protein n=1 Tax=Jiangella alkaliphila TaxID=419479 RepID=A0A1H2LE77_9ACTN|nr:hypothetical protein [Jiangella alkaliphila]SDU78891.1 hypothetical protein SAMN04488563_5885 [Jiangella alkaliphila]
MTTTDGSDAEHRPWLVITPVVERAILVALVQRHGGTVTLSTDELSATTDVTWALEGFRSPENPGQVHVRLRRLE